MILMAVYNMFVWLLILIGLLQVQAEYCFSQCLTSVNVSCGTSPYLCTSYSAPFTALNTLSAGYSSVELISASAIVLAANNYKSSVTMSLTTCSVTYPSTLIFSYNLLGKFVSTDYIYKRFTITQPHYQVMVRLSVVFVGVWSGSDHLNLYVSDGVSEQNTALRYSCTDAGVNYTEIMCGTRVGNKVDCISSFSSTFTHNSTSLLINISSLTREKDPNVQFWSLFDINVITVNCNSLCSACYSAAVSACTACAAGSYLTGNTCGTCAGGTYQLSNPNSLLGGECVAACPQGYYISATSCLSCASGCLSCNSSSTCLISTSSSTTSPSLWKDKMALWVLAIIVGVLLLGALIWCLTRSEKVAEENQRIISELNESKGDEKITEQERQSPSRHDRNEKNNLHIQEIDFNDHVMVDNNPRRRKRQERDLTRSNLQMDY